MFNNLPGLFPTLDLPLIYRDGDEQEKYRNGQALSEDLPSYSKGDVIYSVYHSEYALNELAKILQADSRVDGVVVILFKDWDDDAEKNASRRGIFSYHIHTFTVLIPFGNGAVERHNFPVGLSKKGADNEEFLTIIRKEMEQLCSEPHTFYDGRAKKVCNMEVGKQSILL